MRGSLCHQRHRLRSATGHPPFILVPSLPGHRACCSGRARQRRIRRKLCFRAATAQAQGQVQLVQPVDQQETVSAPHRNLLIYMPGTDGTGNALRPQLPGLLQAGFDVRTIYIPMTNRSDWDQLEADTVALLSELLEADRQNAQAMIVAESFGGCLALRVARAVPQLIERMVLVNPATSFARSYARIPSLIAATNLLSIFPEQLYQVAQAVLVPFLVDKEKVGPAGLEAIRAMMMMQPPDSSQTAGEQQEVAQQKQESRQRLAGLTSFLPSATASWRLSLLNTGNLSDSDLRSIRVPTLVIASAGDKLLPSLSESSRLQQLMPRAQRVVLPDSGHTALLEASVNLVDILRRTGFLPGPASGIPPPPASVTSSLPQTAANGAPAPQGYANSTPATILRVDGRALDRPQQGSSLQLPGSSTSPDRQLPAQASTSSQPPSVRGPIFSEPTRRRDGHSKDGVVMRKLSESGPGFWSLDNSFDEGGAGSNGAQAGSATVPTNGAQPPEPAVASTEEGRRAKGARQAALSARALPSTDEDTLQGLGRSTAVLSDRGAQQPEPPLQASASGGDPAIAAAESTVRATEKQEAGREKHAQLQRGKAKWAAFDTEFEEATQWLALMRVLVSPVMQGVELLPEHDETRPLLFVGNHSRMGVYDLPWILSELYLRGFKVRGLAHRGHWQGPLGPFFERFGAVKASPLAAYRLLNQGEAVLLYPGGGKEVNKRQGTEYQLQWRDSPDFVRLAAKTNAIIIPFACVGGDDAYDVFMDTDTILANPVLGPLARSAAGRIDPNLDVLEAVLPITRLPGLGVPSLFPIPRLERLYFRLMPPVDAAAQLKGLADADGAAAAYAKVRGAVNEGMASLLRDREQDPLRPLQARLRRAVLDNAPAFDLLQGVLPRGPF